MKRLSGPLMDDWRHKPGHPRYPASTLQDNQEEGLSLLREQYEACGWSIENSSNPRLGWGDQLIRDDRKVQLFNSCGVLVKLEGPPEKITALATLIARAVNLGWLMLNELEPVPADGAAGAENASPEAN